jgi:uncharacterized protein YeaO (DUF488 family)
MIAIKRVYEPAGAGDGFRVLVDRLWPRGLSKEKARADLWLKDIAPSGALRKWFAHDPAKWDGFRKRYQAELEGKGDMLDMLLRKAASGRLTLLYGAKDTERNQAVVLKEYLEKMMGKK